MNFRCRYFLIAGLLSSVLILLTGCTEKSVAPQIEPVGPAVDSILVTPGFILPGGQVRLEAVVSNPNNDSLSYAWSTYPRAGRFTDSLAPITDMSIAVNLKAGMMIKVMVDITDGADKFQAHKWISIDTGLTLTGNIYYPQTHIPIPDAEISIGYRADTSDTNGSYILPNIAPNQYDIRAFKPQFDTFSTVVEITSDTSINLFLQSATAVTSVSGQIVTREFAPLMDALVTVINPDGSASELTARTDAGGNYKIENVPYGNIILRIHDGGNPNYKLLTQDFSVDISNPDSSIDFIGRIRRLAFQSEGISSVNLWKFSRYDFWLPWYIDSANDCYRYDFCQATDMGILMMANGIAIPQEAAAVYWVINASIEEASFDIGMQVDGVMIDANKYWGGTKELALDEPLPADIHFLAGHSVKMYIYAWTQRAGISGSVKLREFSLFYYL
ncbi:exported hypothetical protein [Candidatus Zixiibacteriota bacterium]|nr:exported hypothetical protein [candidate division Zixibacteria bacterium]